MNPGWDLVAAISPRPLVRVADVDAYGSVLNSYARIHPVAGMAPSAPWAVHLTDREGRYRLFCADFDAKPDPAQAARDADSFSGVLTDLGVPHAVCASGPSGGRHVWLGLGQPVAASLVVQLARTLKRTHPSLDLSPVSNPATGAVRPPGSPHRHGGASVVLRGDLSVLTAPATTGDDLARVVERLTAIAPPPDELVSPRGRTVDVGVVRIVGRKRALSPAMETLASTTPADGTASHTMMSILCGAARACWSLDDVMRHLLSRPGLEHARSVRSGPGGTRQARPRTGHGSPPATVARMWQTAVASVASTPRAGYDPTFEARADAMAGVVAAIQSRADALPGRWAGARGLVARLVLDALCQLALDAVLTEVEASNRTLALMTGVDRESVRHALALLGERGWVALTQEAVGVNAHHYTITPDAGAIHRSDSFLLSQAGAPPALRGPWQAKLRQRLARQRADVFSSRGLGRVAGVVYGRLGEASSVVELSLTTGLAPAEVSGILERLAGHGLVRSNGDEWAYTEDEAALATAAALVGTDGTTARRAALYALERALWGWWRSEVDWMCSPRAARPRRRAGPRQFAMIGDQRGGVWGAHPRRGDGRADFGEARRILEASDDRRSAAAR